MVIFFSEIVRLAFLSVLAADLLAKLLVLIFDWHCW